VVYNLPAVAPQPAMNLVGSTGPSDFHLFGNLKKGPGCKDIKQAVTSWLDSWHQFLLYWDTSLGAHGTKA